MMMMMMMIIVVIIIIIIIIIIKSSLKFQQPLKEQKDSVPCTQTTIHLKGICLCLPFGMEKIYN